MAISTPLLQRARSMFFESGEDPTGFVDIAILESWRRCQGHRRGTAERIDFSVHDRASVANLRVQHSSLIQDFESTLSSFSSLLHHSGFHPVLTDANATTIARASDARSVSGELFQALQLGSDMSESAIGTAAMNCALSSQRSVQVLGDEHYFDANAEFFCAAAPVFGIDGKLVGAVNLTKHLHGPQFGALSFVESCAAAIEQRQLERLLARLLLRMSWTTDGGSRTGTVAFGADGELLGMTRDAGRLLNPHRHPLEWLSFERLFEGRFGHWLDLLRHSARPLPIRLQSGMFVFVESRTSHVAQTASATPQPAAPQMGDGQFPAQFTIAVKALSKQLSVLLRGETGSGKEVVARELHEQTSPSRPFVAINCAALPEHLIEAELFGYADGAFTGARRGGASGRIEEANGGTLFLDEIGDMPIALQARLLRVLDTHEVTRVGSGKTSKIHFNLICATHQDLESLIETGQFRADLFYRIAGFTLTLKPLRERSQLAPLLQYLLEAVCGHKAGMSAEALELLVSYPWPGNTREVLSVLRRALLMCEPHQILSLEFVRCALPATYLQDRLAAPRNETAPLVLLEEDGILQALKLANGNVTLAANRLGISRSTLQRRIRSNSRLLHARDEHREESHREPITLDFITDRLPV